ncbi:MAG: hypothetical protein DI589_21755 [Shinella sp.]|nr:MAG: hypothetical protein DI589_21755 [Shinella sp.]
MADFVAVIRRAVDGLANNTPEMRVKVYDKARSAVVRQLESMKPRPPEALFQRQLSKLEEAITEVEAEHAEALPADDGITPAPVPVAEPEPVPAESAEEAPVYQAPVPQEEPAAEVYPSEPVANEHAHAEPAADVDHEAATRDAAGYEEPAHTSEPEPAHAPYEEPAAYSDTVETREQVEAGYGDDRPVYEAEETAPEDYVEAVEPVAASDRVLEEPVPHEPVALEPVAPEPVFEPVNHEPEIEPTFAPEEPLTAAASELPHWPEVASSAPTETKPDDGGWDWPSHGQVELPAAPVSPAAQDTGRAADSIIDDFDAYLEGRVAQPVEPAASVPKAAPATAANPDVNDAWRDFEALIGYDAGKAPEAATGAAPAAPVAEERPAAEKPAITEGEERLAGETAYPYRAVPKPRPNIAKIGLAGLAILLLAGGGYALWLNRDSLTNLFNGPSTPSGTPVVATGNGTSTPGNGVAKPVDPAHKIDDGATATKFTQRLTVDGKEVDEGPAAGGAGGAPTGEGQSVAQQNVAPPPQTQQPAGGQSGATATAPVASGEKMYLYEEMLGQSTPTAIEGGVTWEAREEKDDAGRPQAVIQGTITVPGRSLTALVTFKRNSDPSLPASHLVEIVFSLPPGFEGGAIESVQRISMKRTEQDRGNALIAVPARITDDFHMIALNDFPDARATNLELLKTRDWIDIPVTYRNGRRALITMEKGVTGTEAFNKAIAQWQQAEGAQQ